MPLERSEGPILLNVLAVCEPDRLLGKDPNTVDHPAADLHGEVSAEVEVMPIGSSTSRRTTSFHETP